MGRLHALFAAFLLSLACICVSAVGAFAGQSALVAHKTHRQAQTKHGHACRATGKHPHKHRRRCGRSTRVRHNARKPGRALHVGARSRSVTVNLARTPASTSVAIAAVLATPCPNTELTPREGNFEQVQAATLCLVNQERARGGERPLQPNARLAQAAERHNQSMVGEDYFSHVAPDGETPTDRLLSSGYIPDASAGYTIGENLAWGTLYLATPSSIVAAWIASPEHLANILNPEYRDTGVSVVATAPPSLANGQAGATYTQEFGILDS